MKDFKSPFSDDEKETLKGLSSKIAEKRNCTKEYVNKIISGERAISTDKAKLIYADLLELLKFLHLK